MNHRDLVLSARKKHKFHFLKLPDELQDNLVEALDDGSLTLEGARDWLSDRGHSLSHEAIAGYYRAVRRERRLYDATQELTRVVEQFQSENIEDNTRTLANFLIATTVRQLADGELGIKDVDIAKVLMAMKPAGERKVESRKSEGESRSAEAGSSLPTSEIPLSTSPRVLDAETLKNLRISLGL